MHACRSTLEDPTLIIVVLVLVSFPAVRKVRALVRESRIPEFYVSLSPDERRVDFAGGLRSGATAAIEELLAAHSNVVTLRLTSRGGGMNEARKMVRLVLDRGLKVEAFGTCEAEASLVLMAGRERALSGGSTIGFAALSPEATGAPREELEQTALEIFREAEVTKAFAARALSVAPGETWFPSAEELRAAGVITREIGESAVVAEAGEEVDNQSWVKRPLFQRTKRLEPYTYVRLLDELFFGIKRGKTKLETSAAIHWQSARLLGKYIEKTSDAAVLAARDYWLEVLAKVGNTNAESCLAVVLRHDLSEMPAEFARLPGWVHSRGLQVIEQVVTEAAERGDPAPIGETAALVLNATDPASAQCQSIQRFLEESRNLDKEAQLTRIRSVARLGP